MSVSVLSRSVTGQSDATSESRHSSFKFKQARTSSISVNFTSEEIRLLRQTWKEMINEDTHTASSGSGNSSIASSLFCLQFYSNLLLMDANLEEMFPSIKHQAVSFAGVLATALHSLESLDRLDDYLSGLGKRHARILGIEKPHFELMGYAFVKTFHDRFGADFTLHLESCWTRLYSYLANKILEFGIDPVLSLDDLDDLDAVSLVSGGGDHDNGAGSDVGTLLSPATTTGSTAVSQAQTSQTSKIAAAPSVTASNGSSHKHRSLRAVSTGSMLSTRSLPSMKKSSKASRSGDGGDNPEKCVIV